MLNHRPKLITLKLEQLYGLKCGVCELEKSYVSKVCGM